MRRTIARCEQVQVFRWKEQHAPTLMLGDVSATVASLLTNTNPYLKKTIHGNTGRQTMGCVGVKPFSSSNVPLTALRNTFTTANAQIYFSHSILRLRLCHWFEFIGSGCAHIPPQNHHTLCFLKCKLTVTSKSLAPNTIPSPRIKCLLLHASSVCVSFGDVFRCVER